MTMVFAARDKTLLEELVEGKRVVVDFIQEGKDYVATAVRLQALGYKAEGYAGHSNFEFE